MVSTAEGAQNARERSVQGGGESERGTKAPGWGGMTTVMPSLHERAACTLLLSFVGTRDVIVRTCNSVEHNMSLDSMYDEGVEERLDILSQRPGLLSRSHEARNL